MYWSKNGVGGSQLKHETQMRNDTKITGREKRKLNAKKSGKGKKDKEVNEENRRYGWDKMANLSASRSMLISIMRQFLNFAENCFMYASSPYDVYACNISHAHSEEHSY